MTPVDTADLVKWIGPFLGTRGPQWDPHFVNIDGVSALLIAVPPPQPGDPIHFVRRSFHGASGGKQFDMEDGDVIIRAGSETRRARSGELELLMARAAAQGPSLVVSVLDNSAAFTTVDTRADHRERWLRAERDRLLAPLGSVQSESDVAGEGVSKTIRSLILGFETRRESEYRKEVEDYLRRAAETWDIRLSHFAVKHRLATLELEVRNETQHNFQAAELIVQIPGNIRANWEDKWRWIDLPKPPVEWGAQKGLSGLSIGPMPFIAPELDSQRIDPRNTRDIDNSAPARITFDEFDLRPEETYELEPVFLEIGEEHAGLALAASWTLTSKTVSGVTSGTLTFAVERLTAVMTPGATVGELDPEDADSSGES